MTDHCLELVRDWDKDRFLATLFAPDDKQRSLFALFAFKSEIERVPFQVSEPQIGEIRLQWWIDTLQSMTTSEAPDHPVANELQKVLRDHHLPVASLVRLVEAHQFDLYADQMPSRNDLEGYLGEVESVAFQLGAMILDADAAGTHATAAGFAGVAFGLSRLLNREPDDSKFIAKGESRASLDEIARKRLAELRQIKLPRNLLPVFLPVTLCESYLFAGRRPIPQWKRQWRLWRAARKESL
jgi:15-cis-phytoene synthase